MRQVPRRHTAQQTVPSEPPWCRCKYERPMGYRQHPDHPEEYFVHGRCLKPSRTYWEAKVANRTA